MIKRPTPAETEEDVLRMQQEFFSQKAKNPKMQPAANVVKVPKPPKQSLFAKQRQQAVAVEKQQTVEDTDLIHQEIHQKIVGDNADAAASKAVTAIVMGDIVEKVVSQPQRQSTMPQVEEGRAFPRIPKLPIAMNKSKGKSLFAHAMEQSKQSTESDSMATDEGTTQKIPANLAALYGQKSVVLQNTAQAAEIHKQNLELLSSMKEEEILAERKRLLDSVDPALVAMLANRRKEKAKQMASPPKCQDSKKNTAVIANEVSSATTVKQPTTTSNATNTTPPATPMDFTSSTDDLNSLPASNAAVEILQRSSAEQWIHFDVVEKDKLEWMRDISQEAAKLKPGEKFEARFDWKGVLLPYSLTSTETPAEQQKDDRELYLHGEEPHRPGYTLQELFRLARSNVMQQRVTAFSAIAGILNIYQQGFYDQVLELPITKIFFLLRFGFDDNSPAMLEVVGKAMSYLFYNETDETLLDFCYDNPGCQWQPQLQVLKQNSAAEDEISSIEYLQKQMEQLQFSLKGSAKIEANIEENEEESKLSMSDFQLAETDLIECLLRTNILQRIHFILNCVKPDNSTVSSCLKLLIRLARSGKEVAMQIVTNDDLMKCMFENFMPKLETVDTALSTTPFYGYPQYLCLKLMRVLISCNLGIAVKLLNYKLLDILENYLFNREDIKGKLIKAQIEAMRCLRCLILLRVENNQLHKRFVAAFRYMLEWHYNHVAFEKGGPFLIRQHAAALIATIAAIPSPVGAEVTALLADILHDCCCNWFHKATRFGVNEFSQATLLSSCLNAVTWYIRNTDAARYQTLINKYLSEFIVSQSFVQFAKTISSSSIVLRQAIDRRTIHNPLPNAGAVLVSKYGPQLVIAQTYPVYVITALWRLMELLLERNENQLFHTLLKPDILESLVGYLRSLSTRCNRLLATNFYAKMEIKLIYQLLCFEGISTYFTPSEMLQIAYNFLCCLTAEHVPEVEVLFERIIFNGQYIKVEQPRLEKWRKACLEYVYAHYIVVPPMDLTLFLPFSQLPILPCDWPYFQLKIILQNYVDNVQLKTSLEFSEREILDMTLNFVSKLEECNDKLQIVSPTEKLMYLMIAFMGPESQFLDPEINGLLRQHLLQFYRQSQDIHFQFDAEFQGKCKFENLFALFVDHFQAASYGDELFGSLLMVPLAQKYDNKWRRRVWSDYAAALRFLDCSEQLLIGGLAAYLEPCEQEESLIKCYNNALNTNLVRANSLPYKIAKFHVEKFKQQHLKN